MLLAGTQDAFCEAWREWLGAEQQMRTKVDRFARQRMAEKKRQDTPPDLHYWYWLRLVSAQKLTRMLVAYDHSRTIFRLPRSVTKLSFVRWLLVTWWADGGIEELGFSWQERCHDIGKRQG